MESNSWRFRFSNSSSSSSRRHQSRSDPFLGGGYEEFDGDEDFKAEFLCPFCAEDFDIVGLCCHIDEEHPVEVKNGVCPVCAKRVGMDIVSHITMQHGNFLKSLSIAESSADKESTDKESLERKPQQSQLSDQEHEEKARRCEFVRGLLMSTILNENL